MGYGLCGYWKKRKIRKILRHQIRVWNRTCISHEWHDLTITEIDGECFD